MEAKCLRLNMINNLPPSIIEAILSLVPIQEAVRTSILCREWKYHWTKIPKLVFIEDVVKRYDDDEQLSRTSQARRKLFYAVNQVMSMHQGPINEFSLSTYAPGPCVEVDQVIDNLSKQKNTVKKLTLDIFGYSLPESLFSLHKLTDLYLHFCQLDHVPSTFSGFGSLTNLYMENVIITKEMLLLFLSRCPLLKTVVLNPYLGSLSDTDDSTDVDDSTIVELFKCLPVIENFSIRLSLMPFFDQGRVPNKLPAALVHLKYLCIRDTRSAYNYRIPFYVFLIRSSPNLEKLKLKIIYDLSIGESYSIIKDGYSDMWLEHLKELEIEILIPRYFKLEFLRFILAKSPVLKKVKILLRNKLCKDEELKIIRNFLHYPRASRSLEFVIESGVKLDRRPFIRGL